MRMLFFLLIFYQSLLHAEELIVTVEGVGNPIVCQSDAPSMYLCPNGQKPFLVKHNSSGFTALGRDDKKNSKFFRVIQVESLGKTLFQGPKKIPLEIDKFKSLGTEYSDKVGMVTTFFNSNENESEAQRLKGSEAYEVIAQKHIAQKDELKNKLDEIYKEKKYTVELSDGKKLNCTRETTRPLAEKEYKRYSNTEYGMQCGSFKCSPVTVNGKKYEPTLIYKSSPYSGFPATVHLLNKDEIGPKVLVRKVFSTKSPTPLVDNTPYIESLEGDEENENVTRLPEILKQDRQKIAFYKDYDTIMPIDHYKNICASDAPGLSQLISAKEKLFDKLANLELAEFIQVLADGSLTSEFVDINKAIGGGCLYNGVYFNPQAFEKINILKKDLYPDKHIEKTISLEKAKELFNKALAMKDISWKYKSDGCYARAHLVARRFEAEGVRVDKVWLKGELYVPEEDLSWGFHVAPILYVEDKGVIQKMVIDPSLFDKPVTVAEWDKKMTKKNLRESSLTAFPFPDNAATVERTAIAFSSSDPYVPGDNVDMKEAEKMEKAMDAMKRYKQAEIDLGLVSGN